MEGQGVFTSGKGDKYEGSFKAGKKHGQGVLTPVGKPAKGGIWVEGQLQQ